MGYTSQLLYVTPHKFIQIKPCKAGIDYIVVGGEPLTEGSRSILQEIYGPKRVVGMYGTTEARILGIESKGEYVVYSDRSLLAVRCRDGSIGVDGEGELLVTPLCTKGEIPGTLIPHYLVGDRAKVRYENGVYFIRDITRSGDELIIGGANFNPIAMANIIEQHLLKQGLMGVQVFFIFKKDRDTGLIRFVDVVIYTRDNASTIDVKESAWSLLKQYSELVAQKTVDVNIRITSDIGSLLRQYPSIVQRNYRKDSKYIILEH